MLKRILWSWTCNAEWSVYSDVFKVAIRVPVEFPIQQFKIDLKYNEEFNEIILTGVKPDISSQNKIKLTDIEDASQRNEIRQC